MESDPEVLKYIGTPPKKNEEEVLEAIRYVRSQYEKYGMGRLAIEEKSTGEIMGWTGIKYELHIRDFPYYDLGYRLKRKHWGKGIATETGMASIQYGFEGLNLDVINAAAFEGNTTSHNVLSKLGFEKGPDFIFEEKRAFWYELTKDHWLNSNSRD